MENNVVVENNKLVMKLGKDEYLAAGMTEEDYNGLEMIWLVVSKTARSFNEP